MDKYSVNIEKFAGPLDLLLQLIEKEKLSITEVSITKIADQFLEYIEKLDEIEAENLADFLIMASQLILIKSRALLPDLKIEDGEEISAEEQRQKQGIGTHDPPASVHDSVSSCEFHGGFCHERPDGCHFLP